MRNRRVEEESRRRKQLLTLGLSAVVLGTAGSAAAATTGVSAEATDKYCDANGNNCSSIVCIAEADNFRNGLLNQSGTIFTAGVRYTDTNVWDTDFIDPDVSNGTNGGDATNFDVASNTVAYVCLHGTCNDMPGDTCQSAANCGAGGVCIGDPPPNNANGHCAYYQDRYMITTANATGNHYGGYIDYSNGSVKWGETPSVGAWAGAATNGGLNFALLSNSCGIRPGFDHRQDTPIFAGLTVLGIIMPVTYGADDVDAPTRGTALANAYATNPNGSVAHAWSDSLVGIPYNDGGPCGDGNYTYGGGHGVTGCGAQMAQSEDNAESTVLWDRDIESWNQVTNQANGSLGTDWQANAWTCNYDCNKYPFTL